MNIRRHANILGAAAFGAATILGGGIATAAPIQGHDFSSQQSLPRWYTEAGITTNQRCDPPEVIDAHTVVLPCNAEYDVWINNRNYSNSPSLITATVQAVVTGPDGLRVETRPSDNPNSAPTESVDLTQGAERKFDFRGNDMQGVSLHVKSLSSPDYPDELVKVVVTG